MPGSFPTLCCSFAERPSKVGVSHHNAAYRALGLDYTYVAFSVQDAPSAVNTIVDTSATSDQNPGFWEKPGFCLAAALPGSKARVAF